MKSMTHISILLAAVAAVLFVCGKGQARQNDVRYEVEVAIRVDEGLLEGKERIVLVNSTSTPLRRLALKCSASGTVSPDILGNGKPVTLLTSDDANPLEFALATPVDPGETVALDVAFRVSAPDLKDATKMATLVDWHPRVWPGFETHGDYDVRLDAPAGYTVVTSAPPDPESGRYRCRNARSFGLVVTKVHDVLEERVGDVWVRCLYTSKSETCARLLLASAVDVIGFYRERFGLYPYPVLTIVPGVDQPIGGYPVATSIVVVHGMERMTDRDASHWRWLVAHEIGHQYWGEYVIEKDNPGWLWIGLGMYADREYCKARSLGLSKHRICMDCYIQGVRNGYDTTMNISPERFSRIGYDFNNVVIHGKGFSVISALDCVLGADIFDGIYRRCLRDFAVDRLGAREFRAVCQEETGRDLGWFFDAWVNSNKHLSYAIVAKNCEKKGDSYVSLIEVECLGDMKMPVPVAAYFADGTSQQGFTDRFGNISEIRFESAAPLTDAKLDPEGALALVAPMTAVDNESLEAQVRSLPWAGAGPRAMTVFKRAKIGELTDPESWFKLGLTLYDGAYYAEAFDAFQTVADMEPKGSVRALGSLVWQGHLYDLAGKRDEAIQCYRKALEIAGDHQLRHDQYGMKINRQWILARIQEPYRRD